MKIIIIYMHKNGLFIFRRDLRIEDKIYIYI